MKIYFNDLPARLVVKAPWIEDEVFGTDTGGAVFSIEVFDKNSAQELLGILKAATIALEKNFNLRGQ